MDKLGIKATLYDLLGYALPGGIFIAILYFIQSNDTDLLKIISSADVTITGGTLLFFLSYTIGYALSSISSLLFENRLINRIVSMMFANIYDLKTIKYDAKSRELFGKPYSEIGSRTATSFCQKNYPDIYNTAFAFLSIYGMSRNIATALLLTFPALIAKLDIGYWLCYYLILCISMIHNYYRFRVYYIHQIASSILIKI